MFGIEQRVVLLALALGFALLDKIPAQRVWVVTRGGSIQAAIDGASPGDRIEVAGGNWYPSFVVNKALDVVAVGGVASTDAITVRDLPAGTATTLSGFVVGWAASAANCSGELRLRDVRVTNFVSNSTISSCRLVIAERCEFRSTYFFDATPGLIVQDSQLVGIASLFAGSTGPQWSREGLEMRRSVVLLVRSYVAGGRGAGRWWDPSCPCWRAGWPGMHGIAGSGALFLVDGTTVASGDDGMQGAYTSWPVALMGVAFDRTSDTTLIGAANAAQGTIHPPQPALYLPAEVNRGGTLAASVLGGRDEAVALLLDVAMPGATAISGFAFPYWLSQQATFVGLAVTDANGVASFTQVIPNLPWIAYRPLFVQAATASLSPFRLGITAPGVVHVR